MMPANYGLFCSLLGFLFILDWISLAPLAKLFFGPGYRDAKPVHAAPARAAILALWLAAAAALALGFHRLEAAWILTLVFRYYYISTRWTSLYRGGGAPGYVSYYLALFTALFETAAALDASGGLARGAFALFRWDFGMIFLCAGAYKWLVGYLAGEGMEYGVVNPMWGYFHSVLRRLPPRRMLFAIQNAAAVAGELFVGGALLASLWIEPLAAWGGAALILSFLYTALFIRLGRLAFMIMAAGLLALPDLGLSPAPGLSLGGFAAPAPLIAALTAAGAAYMVLLPFVKAKQYLNLFGNRRLPEPFETVLSRYANAVPIILWRVFTPDVTNFFIRIRHVDPSGRETILLDENTGYSYSHGKDLRAKWRWLQVTESIVLTSVFTTLKYFPSDRALFERKLVAYARTLGVRSPGTIRFQYVSIQKGPDAFVYKPVRDYAVYPVTGAVAEHPIDREFSVHAAAPQSPVREAAGYGTYSKKREDA